MDFLPNEDSHLSLVFCRQGKRKLRTFKNKDNPPRCRRQLFQNTESLPEEKGRDITNQQSSPAKDWVTCLKSCLEFDNTTSLKNFQSYLQFMNSCENQVQQNRVLQNSDTLQKSNELNRLVNQETENQRLIADQSLYAYDDVIGRNVLVYLNKTNYTYIISPNIEGTQNSVMLCTENISEENHVISSCVTTTTPSSGLYCDEVMELDELEMNHEEVHYLSGSFDTISCYSGDFWGSVDGLPECSLLHFS